MNAADQLTAAVVRAVAENPEALAQLAAAVAPHVALLTAPVSEGWLDSRAAATYVGETHDAFKKHVHQIASEQDRPGCKRYFRRADLDAWREGQRFHSASTAAA